MCIFYYCFVFVLSIFVLSVCYASSGKPSALYQQTHPDWAPTIKLRPETEKEDVEAQHSKSMKRYNISIYFLLICFTDLQININNSLL